MFLIFRSIRVFADLLVRNVLRSFHLFQDFFGFFVVEPIPIPTQRGVLVEPVSVNIRAHAVTRRFESLDAVDLTEVLQFKASIRQKAPKFLHRTYKAALRQATLTG